MFFRASSLLPAMALASLVVAAPPSVARGGSGSSCGNNNSVQCCNQTYEVRARPLQEIGLFTGNGH